MMKVTENNILQEDIERIVEDKTIEWEKFADKTILITGASGLIGRQLVMSFLLAGEQYGFTIKVAALVHRMEKAERIFGDLVHCPNLYLIEHDITNTIEIADSIDYIIHGASVTSSKSFVKNPVETIYAGVRGCSHILELAKEKKIISGVYLSSMEVYGVNDKGYLSELDYGYIDPVQIRSSYPESKRMCECLCSSYAAEYGVPFKIARLTQTFGAGVEKNDERVFAQFARAVLDKEDIVLFSKGETVRNYCYITDAVVGILLLLLKGEKGQAYNIANEDSQISIYDMADMLIKEFGDSSMRVRIQLENAETHGFHPVSKTCIVCDKIKRLGFRATVDLKQAYARMMQSMQEEQTV